VQDEVNQERNEQDADGMQEEADLTEGDRLHISENGR